MVFISYSSKDIKAVRKLSEFIETTGQKCWYSDRNLDKGKENWMQMLMVALADCEKVLLYLTKNAIDSGEVLNEISNASTKGKNIIPLIAEDVEIPDAIIYLIRKYEWISAYKMEEQSIKDILRRRLLENNNEIRNSFWKTLQTKDYNKFVFTVMERYYGTNFFTTINNQPFGVFCIPALPNFFAKSIKDFDRICDFEKSELSDFDIDDHQNYTQNKWYSEYSAILDGTIRYPNRPGYMLDVIRTDENGYFDKLQVHVGTFAENVYSTHILEYELYKAYLSFQDKDLQNPNTWSDLKNSLAIRNKMHEDVQDITDSMFATSMRESLLKGMGRESLLSVQMLVIIKSKRTQQYELKISQRSNNVVIKPGVYQFTPSGGFEILNDSDDNIYDDIELLENFSPGCAVFREYLEELFNVPEFEGGGTGSIEERLQKDPHIIQIEKMLETGMADLQFLGSVVDLAGLRHELSFALVIHDEEYSNTQFIANEESKKGAIYNIPIADFCKNSAIWKKIHGPSAAMWHLFQKTQLYHSLIKK